MATTTRLALRYPVLSDTADVPRDIGNLASDIDGAVTYSQAAQASRPTASIAGRVFYNTDTGVSTGDLQFDFGSGWRKIAMFKTDGNLDLTSAAQLQWTTDTFLSRISAAVLQNNGLFKSLKGVYVGELTTAARDALAAGTRPRGTIVFNTDNTRLEVNIGSDAVPNWSGVGGSGATTSGLLASRPAYNATNAPGIYYATDQDVTFINIGTGWQRSGAQAGDLFLTMNAAALTGRVLLSGQAWPSTTGIYLDLYTRWSAQFPGNLPDFRGRMPVIVGTHSDVNAVAKVEAGALAVGARRPAHKHAIVDPGHGHNVRKTGNANEGGGTSVFLTKDGSTENTLVTFPFAAEIAAVTGVTVGPQTGSEPTDAVAYFTCNLEAKL